MQELEVAEEYHLRCCAPPVLEDGTLQAESRAWSDAARSVAEEIERIFGVTCSTYPSHGRTGERFGIDVWIAPFRSKANAEQEALGDRIQQYVEANRERFGICYMIWWNWMIEYGPPCATISGGSGGSWFDYEPYAFEWPFGDDSPNTRRHFDHLHLQIYTNHVYQPPNTTTGFTVSHLRAIMPNLSGENAARFHPYLVAACREFGITTRNRLAYFLGQLAHESGELRYWRELGSDAYLRGQPYWPYIGRGPIQLTWRENYQKVGNRLGIDLVTNFSLPEQLAWGFRTSAAFWVGVTNGVNLNLIADNPSTDAFNRIMRTVLGTSHHASWQSRANYTNRAFAVLPANLNLAQGGRVFQNVILAHATHRDGELAATAARVLHANRIKNTVVDADNIAAAHTESMRHPVGWGHYIVIGTEARKKLLAVDPAMQGWILAPTSANAKKTDYRNAANQDFAGRKPRIANALNLIKGGMGKEFRKLAG